MQVGDESLGAFLVESGALPRRSLEEVESAEGLSLSDRLVAAGYLSRDEVRRAEAHLMGVPFVELTRESLREEALFLIPEPLSRTHSVVAYRHGNGEIEVALLDMAALEHLDFLRTEHGFKILPRLTTAESVKRALIHYQKKLKEQFGALARGGAHAAEALLRHAVLSRASHVHLDFKTAGLFVRYRIQGALHEAMTLPREAVELFAKLKDMAGLSKTLHVPQEGSFKVDMQHGEQVRVRAHAAPAHHGERLTLHLHPSSLTRRGFTLESLGFHGESLEEAYRLLNTTRGLIVVEGPPQSGKTTLLYTLLDLTSAHERHAVTVEESIEAPLPYATQMRVRPDVGLDTLGTLRAALKQDPDVVMVGDVRDRRVAELCSSATGRGMLVLAGAESAGFFEDTSTIRGVIQTRVVGRVCTRCSESYKLSRSEAAGFEGVANPDASVGVNFGRVLAALKEEGLVGQDAQWKDVAFARAGAGCRECQSGYKGLVGLQEVRFRGEAPLTLVEDGLFKAAQGITSIEEVVRLAHGWSTAEGVALEVRADISPE